MTTDLQRVPAGRHRLKSRRLRLLMAGGCTYICLWLVTAFIGMPQVRQQVSGKLHAPQSSRDISSEVGFGSGPIGGDVAMPYHWCVARAYAPFLVVTHSGEARGGFDADGESSLHFWLFGFTVKILDLASWIS
jgi:hypothetical protein